MSGSGLQLHKRWLLIGWLIFLTTAYSQQVVNLSHFQPYYDVTAKEITIKGGDTNTLKYFLHELGHHIWFYGDIDTTAYKEKYSEFGNIRELFAHEHYYYFMGDAMEYSKEVFDKFYNR